jgi:hypothetical protein
MKLKKIKKNEIEKDLTGLLREYNEIINELKKLETQEGDDKLLKLNNILEKMRKVEDIINEKS